jgi:hypothetical protein
MRSLNLGLKPSIPHNTAVLHASLVFFFEHQELVCPVFLLVRSTGCLLTFSSVYYLSQSESQRTPLNLKFTTLLPYPPPIISLPIALMPNLP